MSSMAAVSRRVAPEAAVAPRTWSNGSAATVVASAAALATRSPRPSHPGRSAITASSAAPVSRAPDQRPPQLGECPKRLADRGRLVDVMYAPMTTDAETAIGAFVAEFEVKYPKATACLVEDQEPLLTVFSYPAEHWTHLRTRNLIESPFATVRLRQRVTEGCGLPDEGPLMAVKLLETAQRRWRRLNGAHLLPLVRAGVRFVDGAMQERDPTEMEARKEAA